MKSNIEKRVCERRNHTSRIAFSYFNQESTFDTQTLNHCLYGMCFKSSFPLHPGATLCIRVKKFDPNVSSTGLYEGLRSVTLAEVKWCSEVANEHTSQYVIGVKYFAPAY
jgi:hypothetical protein